jgi:hypothetical protein
MATNNSSSSGGIGFLGLLTILFIGLKLTHYIDWSWWWVLAPIWGVFAVVLAVLGVGAFVYVLGLGAPITLDAFAKRKRRARRDELDRLIKASSKADKP